MSGRTRAAMSISATSSAPKLEAMAASGENSVRPQRTTSSAFQASALSCTAPIFSCANELIAAPSTPCRPKIPSKNKNARELLASRAAFKSWKDFSLPRLRILGSQGGPRRPDTLGRAHGNRNSRESHYDHCSYRLNHRPKLSSQSSDPDFAMFLYVPDLLHPQASAGAPPAIDGTTSTRSPS